MDDKLFHTNRTCKMNIRSWWHIPQLQWLGFNYDERNNITKIKEYIDFIVPKLVYVRIVIILLTIPNGDAFSWLKMIFAPGGEGAGQLSNILC